MKRFLTMMLSILIVGLFCVPAEAAGSIDTYREGTLDVHFSLGDEGAVAGMGIDLYRVADVDENGDTTLCGAFTALGVDIPLTPSDSWAIAVTKAINLVRRNGLPPEQSAEMSENGTAHFPEAGNTITAGIYLILPGTVEHDGKTITGQPALAAVPVLDGSWNYNVSASLKGGEVTQDDYLEVVKVWKDKGFEQQRPAYILVDLYCDDVLVDTVQLTTDTNWRYRWEPVPVWKSVGQAGNGPGSDATVEAEHSWYVVERDAQSYGKTYTLNGSRRIVITNTRQQKTPSGEKLPQTGALWWPVPVFAMAGAFLTVLGCGIERKHRYE